MSSYAYSIDTDFPNSKVLPASFKAEIDAAAITPNCLYVKTVGDACTVFFDADLSAGEQTTLSGLVAAHTGAAVSLELKASSKLVENEVAITETTAWQVLGGVVTSADFFVPNLAEAVGRCVGGIKTVGSGVELKIVEDVAGTQSDLNTSPFAPADTSGAWTTFGFNTNVAPTVGPNTYFLKGRLNGATSASVRFTSLSLLKVTVL